MELGNYLPGKNPFKLAGPPQWWLRKLKDFDPDLRVVASEQGFFYRLAIKRPINATTKLVHDTLQKETDTRTLASYGLVPICTLLATANWDNPLMWIDLAERSPKRQGGADAMDKKINEADAQRDFQKFLKQDEMTTNVAKDAWGMYLKNSGRRTSMWVPKTPDRTPKPSQKSPSIIIT